MTDRIFFDMLNARFAKGASTCIGLDSEFGKIPVAYGEEYFHRVHSFNRMIVEATAQYACAFKPNIAFYAGHGDKGLNALRYTISDIHAIAPEVPIILDGKRGDIGNTNIGYVSEAFDVYGADAVTVSSYLGKEAMQPFLDKKDKGIIVLCRTSNPGSGEFQNLRVLLGIEKFKAIEARLERQLPDMSLPLYQYVAYQIAAEWNTNGNCGLVVGATFPKELAQVRQIVGDMPLLIPGIGAQGGDLEATVKAGKDSQGRGMIINASRSIIFDKDPGLAARTMNDSINALRQIA